MSERSEQIVTAAYDLLASEGLEGLTIRSVLTRTGLARRAFYDRFATKDDLVLAVFEQSLSDAARHFSRLVSGIDDPMERLRLIVTSIALGTVAANDASAGRHRRAAALAREHLRLAEARATDLRRAITPILGVIRDQLRAGMVAGVMRDADEDRLALLVYNLVSNTMHGQLIAEERGEPNLAERTRLAEEIWEFCRRAVAQ